MERLVIRRLDGTVVCTLRTGREGKNVGSILDALSSAGHVGALRSDGDILTKEDTVFAGEDVRFVAAAEDIAGDERSFISGSAIVLTAHYYVPWPDLDKLVKDLMSGRWLLMTAPWQSGKSSLLKGLAAPLRKAGYLVLLTSLSPAMVAVANNREKSELEAAKDFFDMLASKICRSSRGWLNKPANSDNIGVADLFTREGKQIIWLVDEASLLNEIFHTGGLVRRILLSELRDCKQYCRPRDPEGTHWLCSFCLCGLPRLSGLIGDIRDERMMTAALAGELYQYSSPAMSSGAYDPLRPMTGLPPSPLSMEISKKDWNLDEKQIKMMLAEYAHDHDIYFRLTRNEVVGDAEHDQAMTSIATDIFGRTSGHKGMVGCCCEVLQRMQAVSFEDWQKLVRTGVVANHTFNSRCYSQLVRNVALYTSPLKDILLECIGSMDGSAEVNNLDTALQALDDGVLIQLESLDEVRLSSALLLATLLESCSVSPMDSMPPPTNSLLVAFESAVTLMDPASFLRTKVLNANGQPSEYIMQSQLFLGLKFVIEKGVYCGCKYRVLAEVKQRDENGKRRMGMDFYLENSTAPAQGIEIQVGGKLAEIIDHIKRSDYYRLLHECVMHYMYFWVGESDEMGAKAAIESEARSYAEVICWYVQYSREARLWTIERLVGDEWHSVEKASAPQFPALLLGTAEPLKKKQKF